jgi:drug/metabolite transporter (DMT)-like permease
MRATVAERRKARPLSGVVLVILSAAAFGTMAIFAPLAYRAGATPITFLFLRFMIAGTTMAGMMAVRGLPFPSGRILWRLVLMGVWYVAQSLCFFTALRTTSPGLVALLLYLYPAVVALISGLALKERMTRAKLISLGLATVGGILTVGPGGDGEMVGIVLAAASALLYAGYIVVGGILIRQVDAFSATTVIVLATGVFYGGIVALTGFEGSQTAVGWWAIVAAGVFSIVAIGGFFVGVEQIGTTNGAILSTPEPMVTVVLAWLFLGDRLEPLRLVGGAFILAAVVYLARSGVGTVERQ